MHRLRCLVGLVAAVTVAGACGGGSSASGFSADPGPISSDLVGALDADVDPDEVPQVQRSFLDWCVRGGEDTLPDVPAVQQEGLLAVCGCSYVGIVDYTHELAREALDDDAPDEEVAGWAFDLYEEIDEDVRGGKEIPQEILDIARACIRSEAGL